jgi:hypothetical protein
MLHLHDAVHTIKRGNRGVPAEDRRPTTEDRQPMTAGVDPSGETVLENLEYLARDAF